MFSDIRGKQIVCRRLFAGVENPFRVPGRLRTRCSGGFIYLAEIKRNLVGKFEFQNRASLINFIQISVDLSSQAQRCRLRHMGERKRSRPGRSGERQIASTDSMNMLDNMIANASRTSGEFTTKKGIRKRALLLLAETLLLVSSALRILRLVRSYLALRCRRAATSSLALVPLRPFRCAHAHTLALSAHTSSSFLFFVFLLFFFYSNILRVHDL